MIDLEKIGTRIKEQRKYILHISQERMAEDLNMYQADISNIEKAKSGSGISDLTKLDLIAEYFDLPLETLLFGREDKNMLTYHGDQMQLKPSKKMLKSHRAILLKLTGHKEDEELNVITYECGPYLIYTLIERQSIVNNPGAQRAGTSKANLSLLKYHSYVFFETELVGVMVSDYTTVFQHVFRPHLDQLRTLIQFDVLDVTDVWRTLNPYWALWNLSENESKKTTYYDAMFKRMDELRQLGEDRPVIYVESVYVREDCRQHGIFRMYIDLIKMMFDGCIIWLNMEPTSGNELEEEYTTLPSYSIAELGQLSINAAVAEKIGFTVDPDTWHRQADTLDSDGNLHVETVLIRKCAYYLPAPIRNLLLNDGDLVAQGRALQKLIQAKEEHPEETLDVNHGMIGEDCASEIRYSNFSGNNYYATAIIRKDDSKRYVISFNSLLHGKESRVIEEYSSLEEAKESKYYESLSLASSFLPVHWQMDNAPLPDEPEIFDVVNDISFSVLDDNDEKVAEIMEVELVRTNTDNAGETLYAVVFATVDGFYHYALNRKSFQTENEDDDLDTIVEYSGDEELVGSKYCALFHQIREYIDKPEI